MDLSLQPKIVIHHKAALSRGGLAVMGLLSPLWLLWIPWVASWLAPAVAQSGDQSLLALLMLFVAVFLVCLFTVYVCLANRFAISADGISFPMRCLLELNFKLKRRWSELEAIEFRRLGRTSTDPAEMILVFQANHQLPLELTAFTKEGLQHFLLAVEAYRPQLPILPALNTVNLGISTKALTTGGLSFTKIWEEDLSGRFGSTVFVPLEPGEALQSGNLQVLGQIAFGGLSAIYLVKGGSGGLCVLKEAVVPSGADAECTAKALEMFNREARLLMGLDHPRIARVLDTFVERGRHYLVLEYIDGKDLRKFIKENGPQTESMVIRWTAEVLSILEYLHSLQPPVIHRDLTPDNLVLEKDGSITLIDFGAANQFLGTATGTLVGKQSYISPEQFRGKALPQSDLYSLGATMSFLLTGVDPEPLAPSSPAALNTSISPALDRFISCLTAMEPQERFQSAVQARQALKEVEQAYRKLKVPDLV